MNPSGGGDLYIEKYYYGTILKLNGNGFSAFPTTAKPGAKLFLQHLIPKRAYSS